MASQQKGAIMPEMSFIRLRKIVGNLAGFVFVATTVHAQPANYQIAGGFNPNSNVATDTWTYREGPPGGPYTLLTAMTLFNIKINNVPNTNPGWWDPTLPNSVPAFQAHMTQPGNWTTQPCCGVVKLPPQTVFYHPGHGNIQAILRFLVPAAQANGRPWKAAKIHYKLTDSDYNGGDGITWEIDHNITMLASGSLFSTNPTSLATTGNQTTSLFPVSGGDTIDFIINSGPNGDESFDTTGLKGFVHLQ
jgi:hypothetical protein